jgi:hypothetical protein
MIRARRYLRLANRKPFCAARRLRGTPLANFAQAFTLVRLFEIFRGGQ